MAFMVETPKGQNKPVTSTNTLAPGHLCPA